MNDMYLPPPLFSRTLFPQSYLFKSNPAFAHLSGKSPADLKRATGMRHPVKSVTFESCLAEKEKATMHPLSSF